MFIKNIFKNLLLFLCIILAVFLSGNETAFGLMTSDSFQITSDVIGSFGAPSESDSFKINDTGGEVGTGDSSSDSFELGAGFWQMASTYQLSIACDASVNMGGITGTGQSALTTNSATCTIDTDNPAGYSLSWKASSENMASGSDIISPYSPATPDTPETWSVDSANSEWGGHLGSASDVVNATTWGSEDSYINGKWLNVSTSDFEIASSSSRAEIGGDDEVIWFGAEIGADKIQPSGSYEASITITAVGL